MPDRMGDVKLLSLFEEGLVELANPESKVLVVELRSLLPCSMSSKLNMSMKPLMMLRASVETAVQLIG